MRKQIKFPQYKKYMKNEEDDEHTLAGFIIRHL